ncbi:MAG: cytidine deaminase [Chloroflexi bacterium]|nr:cytidine deaminase [Chloroflexota bacterium]
MDALSDEMRRELVRAAQEARARAYAPYSNYAVGAALLSAQGRVYTGVNVENAVYPNGTCAERVAVYKAVSEGERQFVAIAVVTANGGSPCGSCRQTLAEFGLDTLVLIADAAGNIHKELSVSELLPGSFGARDLMKD